MLVARIESLVQSTGWSRRLFIAFLGGVSTLALPPADLWPVLFLTLPFLILFSEKAMTKWQSFAVGWWFSFGFFCASLYWISNALLVFSTDFWWLVPFALIGLPLALAVFYGFATLSVGLLFGLRALPEKRLWRIIAMTGAMGLADLLRGTLFTGFPWNIFGYAWSGTEALSQGAALLGVYGLGFLVLISGFLISLLGQRKPWFVVGSAFLFPTVMFGYGLGRLGQAPDLSVSQLDETRPGIRLVQTNIPQNEKWGAEFRERNFQLNLTDSMANRPDWVSTVIWPETAASFLIESRRFESYRAAAAQYATPENGLLITGAPRAIKQGNRSNLHNSAVVLDDAGTVIETYDKAHLVPFGEYVPFAQFLPFEAVGGLGFTPGPGLRSLTLPGLPPVSFLICYEVIFPGKAVVPEDRPAWLLNITNDAWYGDSAGPYQHLQHARMRAVEEGLPMIRPANTGISVAVDGYGREIGRIGLSERGVLDFRLPLALPPTLYARTGNLPAWIIGIVCLLLGWSIGKRAGQSPTVA